MYDTKFTSGQVTKKNKPGMNYRTVVTPEDKYLCFVSSSKICDLNGRVIANFSHTEKKYVQSSGKDPVRREYHVRVYHSDFGDFRVRGNYFYHKYDYLGKMPARKLPFIFLLLFFILIALSIGTAIINLPHVESPSTPVIDIVDDNGNWNTQETIAVFGEKIKPGSGGAYEFKICNQNDTKFIYDFSIKEYYNEEPVNSFPLEYRVHINNEVVGDGGWLSASELKFEDFISEEQSVCIVTLEWRWPFEGANDDEDTYFGNDGGRYTLELFLTAESVG